MANRLCMLSFDIEEWFQSENFNGIIPRNQWSLQESSIVKNTMVLLELLENYNYKATFFILGWIAERIPDLVVQIAKHGHEIASHGYAHELIYRQNPQDFLNDVRKSKEILENIAGVRVHGYRAPAFSITEWALDLLMEAGYTYDSSLFPVSFHDRYGSIKSNLLATEKVFLIRDRLIEMSLPTLDIMHLNLPWAGGGYFRLLPYAVFRSGINKILQSQNHFIFYFHPAELDADQPFVKELKPSLRFRQYVGLKSTYRKLNKLFAQYSFVSIMEGLDMMGYKILFNK